MSEITRKIAAVVLTFALALSMGVTVGFAEESTNEELQEQITELQALIASLQAQLAGTPTTPTGTAPTACAGVTAFSANLSLGSTGNDVKCLQAMLNMDPATQVAASGVGSAGQESTYFGQLTKAAVVKFQNKYASEVLTPVGLTVGTGFVGTQTRTKLNAMFATGTTPTTPDEDDEDEEYTGVEGELSLKALPTPANNAVLDWGSSNEALMNIELKAKNSPIKVSRIDLLFDVARPWDHVNYVSLYDGDSALTGKAMSSANTSEVTATSRKMRFSGLNITVPANGTKTITVAVSTDSRPRTLTAMTVSVLADYARGTDGAGLTQYNTGTAVRTFTGAATAEGATATLTLSTETPAEGIAITDVNTATEHELFRFNVKATKNSAQLTSLTFTRGGSAGAADVVAYKLYDGTTLLGSESRAATFTFANLAVDIAKDATKTLSVKVEMAKNVSSVTEQVSVAAIGDVVGTSGNDEVLTISGTPAGKTITFYTAAPVVSNVTTNLVETKNATGNTTMLEATIQFTLTAQGGDISISSTVNAAKGIKYDWYADGVLVTTGTAAAVAVDGFPPTVTTTITQGTGKVFTIQYALVGGAANKRYGLAVNSLEWINPTTNVKLGGLTAELMKALMTTGVVWK
jgi:hypothetical protein